MSCIRGWSTPSSYRGAQWEIDRLPEVIVFISVWRLRGRISHLPEVVWGHCYVSPLAFSWCESSSGLGAMKASVCERLAFNEVLSRVHWCWGRQGRALQ